MELRQSPRLKQTQQLTLATQLQKLFEPSDDTGDPYEPLRDTLEKLMSESAGSDGQQLFRTREEDIKIESLEDFNGFIQGLIAGFEEAIGRDYRLSKNYRKALERACYLAFIVHFGVKRKEKDEQGYPLDYVVHTLRTAFVSGPELGMSSKPLFNVLRAVVGILHDTFEDWKKGRMIIELESGAVVEALRICIREKIQAVIYHGRKEQNRPCDIVERIEQVTKPENSSRVEAFLHLFTGLEDTMDLLGLEVKLADRHDNSKSFDEHGDKLKTYLLQVETEILSKVVARYFAMNQAADRQMAILRRGDREQPLTISEDENRYWVQPLLEDLGYFMERDTQGHPDTFTKENYTVSFLPRNRTYGQNEFKGGIPHLGHIYIYHTKKIGDKNRQRQFREKVGAFFRQYAPQPTDLRELHMMSGATGNPLDTSNMIHGRIIYARNEAAENRAPFVAWSVFDDEVQAAAGRLGFAESYFALEGQNSNSARAARQRYDALLKERMRTMREAALSVLPNAGNISLMMQNYGLKGPTLVSLQAALLSYFEALILSKPDQKVDEIYIEGQNDPIKILSGLNIMQFLTIWDFSCLDNYRVMIRRRSGWESVKDDYVLQDGDKLKIQRGKSLFGEATPSKRRFTCAVRRIESFETMIGYGQASEAVQSVNRFGNELRSYFQDL